MEAKRDQLLNFWHSSSLRPFSKLFLTESVTCCQFILNALQSRTTARATKSKLVFLFAEVRLGHKKFLNDTGLLCVHMPQILSFVKFRVVVTSHSFNVSLVGGILLKRNAFLNHCPGSFAKLSWHVLHCRLNRKTSRFIHLVLVLHSQLPRYVFRGRFEHVDSRIGF